MHQYCEFNFYIRNTYIIHYYLSYSEIGVLTANKVSTRQYKIVAPLNPEKPIKYVRKPIDYSLLDEVGHGIQSANKNKHRAASQLVTAAAAALVGPPPTTKPPTPPQLGRGNTGTLRAGNTGTLGKSSKEYRTPPVVVPPQVPSHYAPNYPVGHPRRSGSERGPGYSALPVPPSQQIATHSTQIIQNPTPVSIISKCFLYI